VVSSNEQNRIECLGLTINDKYVYIHFQLDMAVVLTGIFIMK